ncbi:hypothetical protein [Methanolobus sp. ZRKC5]|uniref:hypothetical protein n=1 Tax=unclassified Methanolobus TaxID=2629569 RepID=UPI00313CE15B
MDRVQILKRLETRLPSCSKFEEMVIKHLQENYFAFVYQAMYIQLGYKERNNKFTNQEFKELLSNNNFVDFINEVYRTHLSWEGVKEVKNRLQQVEDFDDYVSSLQAFESCDPITYKNGKEIQKNAFSFGTKILHFYNPDENPILDSFVRTNLKIKGEMDKDLCIEFREGAREFAQLHHDYFVYFNESENIRQELAKRHMTSDFPIMEIFDMALYEPEK